MSRPLRVEFEGAFYHVTSRGDRREPIRRMQARARADSLDRPDIPRAQRRPPGRPLPWYFKQHDRDTAIARAFADGGYTQTAIARACGLSVSRVSRLIAVGEARGKT